MRLATIKLEGKEQAAIVVQKGMIAIDQLNAVYKTSWKTSVYDLLINEQCELLDEWISNLSDEQLASLDAIPFNRVEYAPLYRHPRKICGIGMNYWKKAEDLGAVPPAQEPIVFFKPDTSLIGHQEAIIIPQGLEQVTAEAELGIIIGKACKNVNEQDAMCVVAGVVPTLDMTAQDIHARNPRFLGRSKVMDTFFSFGPQLLTINEFPSLAELSIVTKLNGEAIHHNTVSHMIYNIPFIVSYFSEMMTLQPGDIIMTGTPGSVRIQAGDIAACYISGVEELINPVRNQTSY